MKNQKDYKSNIKYPILAERYRALRESAGSMEKDCTQDELAKRLHITKTQISDLERGKREPSITELKVYSKLFEVPMEYLLGISNNKNYENIKAGKELGLSDSSIKRLKQYNELSNVEYDEMSKRNIQNLNFLNFLIGEDKSHLIFKIQDYILASPEKFDSLPIFDKNIPIKNTDGTKDSLSIEDIESIKLLKIQKTLIELKKQFNANSKAV